MIRALKRSNHPAHLQIRMTLHLLTTMTLNRAEAEAETRAEQEEVTLTDLLAHRLLRDAQDAMASILRTFVLWEISAWQR